jgi:hypothetical protein
MTSEIILFKAIVSEVDQKIQQINNAHVAIIVDVIGAVVLVTRIWECAWTIVIGGRGIEIVAFAVGAPGIVQIVANAVVVFIWSAAAAANPKCVGLIAATIAVSVRNACAAAVEERSRSIAYAASIKGSNASINGVAYAILIEVGSAGSTAHADCVGLISIAVAIPFWNVVAPALEGLTYAIAHSTSIKGTHARVDVVANSVLVGIGRAGSPTNAQYVQLLTIAVAIPFWNVVAPTLENVAYAFANSAHIECAYTGVDVVTNAVLVKVDSTGSVANAKCVELIAIAVAVALWNVVAPALEDVPYSIAHAASIECANTRVDVVANAVLVDVCWAASAADAERVELIAIAVTFSIGHTIAPALKGRTGAVANATVIQGANARIDVVTNAVAIFIGHAVSAAVSDDVCLVAIAIAIAIGNACAAAIIDIAWAVADAAGV